MTEEIANPEVPDVIEPLRWGWLTREMFVEFAMAIGLSLDCLKCKRPFPNIFIDTVSDEKMIARSSTFGNSENGGVNLFHSRHLSCVRTRCKTCGHIDLYEMDAIDRWRMMKAQEVAQNVEQ